MKTNENFYETTVFNGDCTVKVTAERKGTKIYCEVEQIKGHDKYRKRFVQRTYTENPESPRPIKRWADNAFDAWSCGD